MDSDNITDEDEQDSISKQIVDYYRKYSLSRDLPKYLSGNSLSYMPKIVAEDDKVQITNETVSERQMIDSSGEEINNADEEELEEKPVSPSSSTVSTRKLEWDNGADIGYVNCEKIQTKIHKSTSLPTVLTESKKNDEKTTQTQVLRVISPSSSSLEYLKDAAGVQSSSSSTSASFPVEKPAISSISSSNYGRRVPGGSSSSSLATTLAYIKSKIGDPEAESTPKIFEKVILQYSETPIVKTKSKQGKKKRIFELCRTKPILIECIDNRRKGTDKIIQTSFRECISEGIQTSDSLLPSPTIPVQNNQSIIIIDNSEGRTETDSEAISLRSEGFEYVPAEQIRKQANLLAKQTALSSSSTEDSSIPLLAQLISQNQSKSLVGDVDRSISILQKLLKSKKYDDATKKRYIKKIVQKIVDSKYSEDSSTSSELFKPKRDSTNQKLNENLPWVPPQLSKFTVKTVTDEFLPEKSEQKQIKQKSIFTLSNSAESSHSSWKEDKTMSERLLENQKQQGQGDQLVKFAKQERQNQLAWINDEISHLTKLKGLLEEKQIVPSQKTTTVYMLSHNKSPGSKKKSGRNYVIETELAGGSSSDSISFNFQENNGGSKNYHVRTGKSAHESHSKKLVGNIEVVSDENSTNIKVKTKRVEETGEFAPKRPSLVGEGKYDTFPRSQRENKVDRCWPCGMPIRKYPEVEKSWSSGMPKTRKHSLHSNQGSTKSYVIDVPLSQIRTTLSNLNKISNQKLRRCSDATQCELGCDCKSNIQEMPQECEATCLYQKPPRQHQQDLLPKPNLCSDSVQCEMGCTCKDGITWQDKNTATFAPERSSKRVQMDNQSKRRNSKTQYDPRLSSGGTSESVQASVESRNQVIETVPKQTKSRNSQSSQDTNSVQIQYDPLEQNSQNSQIQCEIRNDSRDQVMETVHVETVHRLVQKDPEQARNILTQYESYACSESVQCEIPCDCKQNVQNRDIMVETQRTSYVNKNVQESDDFYGNSRRIFEQQLREEDNERRRATRCSESVQCRIGCECKDVCSKYVQCQEGCECKSREYTAISDRIRQRTGSREYSVRFHPDHLQQPSFSDSRGESSEFRNMPSERNREENQRRAHVCDRTRECEFCDTAKCDNSTGKCVLCKQFVQNFDENSEFYDSDPNANQTRDKEHAQILNKNKTETRQKAQDRVNMDTDQNWQKLEVSEDYPNPPRPKTSIHIKDKTKTKQRSKDSLSADIDQKTSEVNHSATFQKTAMKSSETSIHSTDQTLPENVEDTQTNAPKDDQEDDVYIQSFVNIFGDKNKVIIPETTEIQPMSTIAEVSESYTESQPGSAKKSDKNLRPSKELQTDSVSDSESETSSNVTLSLRGNERENTTTTTSDSKSSVASSEIPETEARRIIKQISEKIQKTGSFDSENIDHQCRVEEEIDDLVASRLGPSGVALQPRKTSRNRDDDSTPNNLTEFDKISSGKQQKNPKESHRNGGGFQDSSERITRNQTEDPVRLQHKNRVTSQSSYDRTQRSSDGNYQDYNFAEDESDTLNTQRGSADRKTQREEQSRRKYSNESDGINSHASQRGYERNQRNSDDGNYRDPYDFDEERRKPHKSADGKIQRDEQSRRKYSNESDSRSSQKGYDRNQRTLKSVDERDKHSRNRYINEPERIDSSSSQRGYQTNQRTSDKTTYGFDQERARPVSRDFSKDSINRDRNPNQQKTRIGSDDDPSYAPYREHPRRSYFIEPENKTEGIRGNFEAIQRITNRPRNQEPYQFNPEQTSQKKCIVCCDCKKDRNGVKASFSGESISDNNRNVHDRPQQIGHSFSQQAYNDLDHIRRGSQDSKRNFLSNEKEEDNVSNGSVPARRTNTCICTAENLPVYEIPPCICRPTSQKLPNCICFPGGSSNRVDINEGRNYQQTTGELLDGNNARRNYGPQSDRKLQKDSIGRNEEVGSKDSNSDSSGDRAGKAETRATSSKKGKGINFSEDAEHLETQKPQTRDYNERRKLQKDSTGKRDSSEELGRRKDSNSDSSSGRSDDKPENQANSSKTKNSRNSREDTENLRTKHSTAGRNDSSGEFSKRKDSNSDSSSRRSDDNPENQAKSSKTKNRNVREEKENSVQSKNRNKSENELTETPEESGRRKNSNSSSQSQQSGNKPEKVDSNYFPEKKTINSDDEKKGSESSEDKAKNGEAIEEKTDQVSTLSSSSSSGSSSDSSSSESGSLSSCACCKRNMRLPSKTLFQLKDTINNQVIPLCRPCYRTYQGTPQNVYLNPTHICGCYSLINKQTLDEIKRTINDLDELNNECYCSCADVKHLKSSKYCKHCKCKLKKTTKSKNGIAYMLTFEETKPGEKPDGDEEDTEKKKPLEEIKIKIPVAYKKKQKDKANKKKKKKKKKEEEGEQARVVTLCTLQEYLCKNRPQFVEIAECRRKSLIDSRCERQESSEVKKMRFLLNYSSQPAEKNEKYAKPRLFSAKEVREINKKNYKKLPEVQQKLVDNKEKQLRQANRLIADTFNRKLRDNVLKGKLTISADVNVVNL